MLARTLSLAESVSSQMHYEVEVVPKKIVKRRNITRAKVAPAEVGSAGGGSSAIARNGEENEVKSVGVGLYW
jgi:hypothetical protein